MGIFRRSFLIVTCILFFISMLTLNLLFTLSASLKYENVQQEISPLITQLSNSSGDSAGFGDGEFNFDKATDDAVKQMQTYCQSNPDYVFTFENYSISVPCSSLQGGKEAVINETAKSMIREIYYKNYDCDFWNCFSKEQVPFFLVSQKARDYWKGKFYIFLLVSSVLLALVLLLSEKRSNGLILSGAVVILSSLPLLKIKDAFSSLIHQDLNTISPILGIFFNEVFFVFFVVFIIGLILLGLGIGLKITNMGFVKKIIDKKEEKEKK